MTCSLGLRDLFMMGRGAGVTFPEAPGESPMSYRAAFSFLFLSWCWISNTFYFLVTFNEAFIHTHTHMCVYT